MESFYIDMGIGIVITLLKGLKGPEKKKQLKSVFLKINKLIQGTYGDDADFTSIWNA